VGRYKLWSHNAPYENEKIKLAGVEVYGGLAAVDGYIGATQESEFDKTFGGGHVIEMLIRGENLLLEAYGKGTDCYPGKYFRGYYQQGYDKRFLPIQSKKCLSKLCCSYK